MARHVILGIHVTNRVGKAGAVQQALTEFGCYIKTRLGLHEASKDFCSSTGIILLEVLDLEGKPEALFQKLQSIDGIDVQRMIFED